MIGRPGAESKDYLPGSVAEGTGAEEPLQLTKNERDIIEMAKECSDNVIVLLNTANSMEIDETEARSGDRLDLVGRFPWKLWYAGCCGYLKRTCQPIRRSS